jgi:hypothetical protein
MADQPWFYKLAECVGLASAGIGSYFAFRKAREEHDSESLRRLAKGLQELRSEFEVHSNLMHQRMLAVEQGLSDSNRKARQIYQEMQEGWLDYVSRMESAFKRIRALAGETGHHELGHHEPPEGTNNVDRKRDSV